MPLRVTQEMQRLIDKPGYLPAFGGGQELRELFSDGSRTFNADADLTSFGLLCYLGAVEEVKKLVRSGQAPDLFGTETAYKTGYLTLVVFGSQRVTAARGTDPSIRHWPATMKFLLESGCPTEVQDVVGYTAIMHACLNIPVPGLVRILAEAGADVNHRNKFGAVALHEACMQKSVACLGILMEYGASLEIPDGDGITGDRFYKLCGPEVVAEVSKWLRKRSGEEGALQSKNCDYCGKSSKNPNVKLSFCSRCRMKRYCSSDCQKADWKAHKASCKAFSADGSTVTVKPTYNEGGEFIGNPAELTREMMSRMGLSGVPATEPKPKKKDINSIPVDVSDGRQFIIKIQVPVHDGVAPPEMMVYNHKRDFRCFIERATNVAAYDKLKKIINEKGAMGLKGYFMAELKNKNELMVKTEVISEQAW